MSFCERIVGNSETMAVAGEKSKFVAIGDDVTRLPPPEAFVPLYLYLLAGQPKAESGGVIDAQASLSGR